MGGLLKQFVPTGLMVSLALLGLGLTMEGLAGPYSLWGIGTGIAFVGVLGTGDSVVCMWGCSPAVLRHK